MRLDPQQVAAGDPGGGSLAPAATAGRTAPPRTVALIRAGAADPTPPVHARERIAMPFELLGAATAIRSSDAFEGGSLTLRLIDALAPIEGGGSAASRALELRPAAAVLGADLSDTRDRVLPERRKGSVRSLVEAGRELGGPGMLAGGRAPFRIALTDEDPASAETLLGEGAAELVLRGDAEGTLPRVLADALAGRTDWTGVRGVSWSEVATDPPGSGGATGPARVRHERVGHAPLHPPAPAWDLVDLAAYRGSTTGGWSSGWAARLMNTLPTRARLARSVDGQPAPGRDSSGRARRGTSTATILTTRACSPDCPTCHGSFGAASRERSTADVIAEIRDLVTRSGVRHIAIGDRAFDGRPARALEIARAIAAFRRGPGRRSLRVTFPHGLRGDGLTPELVAALIDAGVRVFPLHIVTASPRLQRLLKTNVSLHRVERSLAAVDDGGAIGHLRLWLGLPTETTGEVAGTIRWARESRAHSASFLPGRTVDLGPAWTRESAGEVDDFAGLRRRALRAFYSSPRRAGRLARTMPRSLLGRLAH